MSSQYQSSADHVPQAQARDDKPYPPYYYLWHLCTLGVLRAERVDGSPCPRIVGTVWDDLDTECGSEAYHPATIAMIDVGVGHNHPNLMQVDMGRAIDLVTHRYGARRRPIVADGDLHSEKKLAFFDNLSIEGLDLRSFSEDEQKALTSFVNELKESRGVVRMTEALDAALPSHGTAVAGLAVGDPGLVFNGDGGVPEPVSLQDFVKQGPKGRPLSIRNNVVPYVGVDPFSKLVPIKTSFDEDPRPLMAALLYAYKIGSDVILMPRDIPDPTRGILTVKEEQSAQECQNGSASGAIRRDESATRDEWTILKKLLISISKKIPIVCAAGNSGESQLIYPACLAGEGADGKETNGIIAVGAVNADGCRAGYSNYGEGLTVVAPSNDGEIYNRYQARIDWGNPATKLHQYGLGSLQEIPYSHYTIATTDLPGAWGYAGGSVPYVANLPPEKNPGFAGGYYTGFGGTSAAAGLIAGVVALMSRAHKAYAGSDARLSGIEAKTTLMAAANLRPERLQSQSDEARGFEFKPDPMNSEVEAKGDPILFFGAGLVDAAEAIKKVRSLGKV